MRTLCDSCHEEHESHIAFNPRHICKFPMHKQRINLNFPGTALTFGFKAKVFDKIERFAVEKFGAVLVGTAHARGV